MHLKKVTVHFHGESFTKTEIFTQMHNVKVLFIYLCLSTSNLKDYQKSVMYIIVKKLWERK